MLKYTIENPLSDFWALQNNRKECFRDKDGNWTRTFVTFTANDSLKKVYQRATYVPLIHTLWNQEKEVVTCPFSSSMWHTAWCHCGALSLAGQMKKKQQSQKWDIITKGKKKGALKFWNTIIMLCCMGAISYHSTNLKWKWTKSKVDAQKHQPHGKGDAAHNH